MTNTKQNGSANRKPVDYTLHLRFDVAQTTKALQFEFISTDGHSPMKTVGDLAGTCNFMPGDTIKIMVTATGLDSAVQRRLNRLMKARSPRCILAIRLILASLIVPLSLSGH